MKLYSLLVFSFAAFILLQSAGCGSDIKELEYKGIQKTQIQTLSFNNAAIRVDLSYYNPNNFGLDVKETNLSIYLNDKFVALADQPEKTQIPKMANFSFPIVAHFDPLKILGPALASIVTKKNKMSIQGTAKIGKSGVYIKVPILIEEEVKIFTN
jgi:LEA14-like dessication related protein